jgi:hypothetical protein
VSVIWQSEKAAPPASCRRDEADHFDRASHDRWVVWFYWLCAVLYAGLFCWLAIQIHAIARAMFG